MHPNTSVPDYPVIDRGAIRLRPYRDSDWPEVLLAATAPYIVATSTLPADSDKPGARDFIARQQGRLAEGTG